MDQDIRDKEVEVKEDRRAVVTEQPVILEEINIEELAVDGICGIY